MKITNLTDIPLALAVWLAHDEYDLILDNNYISATRLMKPIRQIVLPSRVPLQERQADIADFIASTLGHSLHDSIEKAWVTGYAASLRKLGYPKNVIEAVMINPTPEQLKANPNGIPVYLEQRGIREIKVNGVTYKVGGKFDMVIEGIVHDNKSTTAYTWTAGTKDDDYRLQMSIYRWLHPDKITEDFGRINFIFTDWQRFLAKNNPNYPQSRLEQKEIALMSMDEIENWIHTKLAAIQRYTDAPEPKVPFCTNEELWMSDPRYKYFSDPAKAQVAGARSTKNFDTLVEANAFMAEKGKGVVVTIPGEPKRCGYCDAYEICTQTNKAVL